MLFNSTIFLFYFAPLAITAISLARRHSSRAFALTITVASFIFYAWFDVVLLIVMLASLVLNFAIARHVRHKAIFVTAVILNLLPLVVVKYADVIGGAFAPLVNFEWVALNLVIPLGISFYTLHQIGYLVDLRNGDAEPRRDFLEYAAFVAFFPQLIAGPIVRANQFFFQLQATKADPWPGLSLGITWFAIGLFKKVVLADSIAPLADRLFEKAAMQGLTTFEAWAAAFAFGLQLYFDFAGYSTMAVGLALMCGIALPFNFDTPYRSRSPREFWRRWHITLSEFLRDRVFIPLGGSRKGVARTVIALVATMVLGGLWHGAGPQFAVWGAYHGALLVFAHVLASGQPSPPDTSHPAMSVHSLLGWALTLSAVMLGWLFFRAPSLGIAVEMFWTALGIVNPFNWAALTAQDIAGLSDYWLVPAFLVLAIAIPDVPKIGCADQQTFVPELGRLAITCGLLAISMIYLTDYSPFLYFQF